MLNSKVLVVAGALDGSSGFILSVIMCKAMNRSFTNVHVWRLRPGASVRARPPWKRKSCAAPAPEEAAAILAGATKVVIVPGYGMAVAQAQHKVRELYDALTKRGVDVKFGIHPVAGRMPGHMNVLLAEADIPYDRLLDMDDINSRIAADRCGPGDRRERRHQSRRAQRTRQSRSTECPFSTWTKRAPSWSSSAA